MVSSQFLERGVSVVTEVGKDWEKKKARVGRCPPESPTSSGWNLKAGAFGSRPAMSQVWG